MEKDNRFQEKTRTLRLVEKYDSDDHSRFAAPDFVEHEPETGRPPVTDVSVRPEGNWQHPGVSGKSDKEGTWFNQEEYDQQTDFRNQGPKGYIRSDDKIYEEACDNLMRNSAIDASEIAVKVTDGVVYLSGKVGSRRIKKLAESVVENLTGVHDVRNELTIIKTEVTLGPDAATKKDLGIN